MAGYRQRFSQRTAWDLSPSDFSTAIGSARAAGRDLIDLTVSNPTRCGFDCDANAIFAPLASEENQRLALTYDPDPRGLRSARESVALYYSDHAASVDPDSILLTTSTSEAYSWLFRLLCDPGDEVLVAQPSYPLFDFLATLDDVVLKSYSLFYDYGWWIDFAELERRIGPRTRAILVVHPNNPTGHWTHRAEREKLEALCTRHGLALIVDEVFLDYPVESPANESQAASFATAPNSALTFVLSGISKVCALPQMKVSWIAVLGPKPTASEAIARLEVIADTFLSMNAPAQLALPAWLATRSDIQRQLRTRVAANLECLMSSGIEVLKLEAGWSAVLRLRTSTSAAALLLDYANVVVHPGAFYGLADPRMIVISLITPTRIFAKGVGKLGELEANMNLTGYPYPDRPKA